jgi:hypothetical protein
MHPACQATNGANDSIDVRIGRKKAKEKTMFFSPSLNLCQGFFQAGGWIQSKNSQKVCV